MSIHIPSFHLSTPHLNAPHFSAIVRGRACRRVSQGHAYRRSVRGGRVLHALTALTGLGVVAAGVASAIVSLTQM